MSKSLILSFLPSIDLVCASTLPEKWLPTLYTLMNFEPCRFNNICLFQIRDRFSSNLLFNLKIKPVH